MFKYLLQSQFNIQRHLYMSWQHIEAKCKNSI